MEKGYIYDIKLPEKVSNILETDFWVLEKLTAAMLPSIGNPIKFSSNVSVFVKKGTCKIDINLMSYTIMAPCVVNIKTSQILQMSYLSDDFEASFIVMSRHFCDNLFLLLQECRFYPLAVREQNFDLPLWMVPRLESLYSHMAEIFNDHKNPFAYQAMTLAIASFFYENAYRCFMPLSDEGMDFSKGNSRITARFIGLVQQNFKTERFLEFYADKLEISPKHLSRTMKSVTGFSAVEWIERYVILEAKVLLKSTNLNIQQISDELNFPSQSFFGKYFKKNVGMSPKEFRNS